MPLDKLKAPSIAEGPLDKLKAPSMVEGLRVDTALRWTQSPELAEGSALFILI
jgi:hypothetical protein